MTRVVSSRRVGVRAVLALCAVLLVGVPVQGAAAAPAPSVSEVRARIKALREQAENATERYNAVREDIAGLDVRISGARTKLAQERAALAQAREELGRWASDAYKAGDLATVSLFLSDDPDTRLRTDGTVQSLTDRRADIVGDLLRQQKTLVASSTDITEQQQRLEQSRQELEATRKDVERKLADADRQLGALTGDQRHELAEADAQEDRDGLAEAGVEVPASGRLTCSDVPTGPLDARVAKVIGYACAQLGDPYRWGASGPGRFDCSGLVMMAWRQAGVSLPHNAAAQARQGARVPASQLKPGDVVFFYSPIGHDGIYLGNGLMIHAPQTGDRVKIAPVRGVRSFTTAVRL